MNYDEEIFRIRRDNQLIFLGSEPHKLQFVLHMLGLIHLSMILGSRAYL